VESESAIFVRPTRAVSRRRWWPAALVVVFVAASCTVGDGAASDRIGAKVSSSSSSTSTSTVAPTTTTTTLVPPDGKTAADRTLTLEQEISGDLTPKSVVWSGRDRFFAQNMVYTHTIGVYDRAYQRVALIPDTVRLADFGFPQYPDTYQGGPVEADFTGDGAYAYVSNYQMYGPGFENPGNDECGPGDWDPSFVYRIDVAQLRIDQVIEVGSVPKYVAVTPDNRYVLVTNWCGYDMSVIDTATATEVTRLPIGRFPRGIVVSPDSRTAYVAIMGGTAIAVVDLTTLTVTGQIEGVGSAPRHLVLSPDGATLYVTLNGEGDVAKIDLATGSVVGRVATGQAPRSMDISDDGTALFVVNYESATVSKVRTADMVETQSLGTNQHPIGITYDAAARKVWVANYSGTLQVFTDV
jgi:YVTN family beta-propeller protein